MYIKGSRNNANAQLSPENDLKPFRAFALPAGYQDFHFGRFPSGPTMKLYNQVARDKKTGPCRKRTIL